MLDPIKRLFSTAFPLKRMTASLTALYSLLLQTTIVTGMLYRAAVHSACMEMVKAPSPTKAMTWRSGCASLMPNDAGSPHPRQPPVERK